MMVMTTHITSSSDGYTSTLDSPDQRAKGILVTSTTLTDQVLKFQVVNLGIQYTGELKNKLITGRDQKLVEPKQAK